MIIFAAARDSHANTVSQGAETGAALMTLQFRSSHA